jgi:FdhE protein
MTTAAPAFQPVHIGEEAAPPAVVLPVPETLFAQRAMRFRQLAEGHQLAGYLKVLAGISDVQAALLPGLPAVEPLPVEDVERAAGYGMPPLPRNPAAIDPVLLATLDRFLDAAGALDMPEAARAALDGVIAASEDEKRTMVQNVLEDSIPFDEVAEHVFVAAAVQLHFARRAAALPAEKMVSVADGACPSCGGPPVTSSVVGWQGSQSARFATCSCCATQWHVVRVKCVACSSTKGISYAHVQGTADTLKAECCDSCGGYLKILYAVQDPELDPVADDVASAGLDLMVKDEGKRRVGFNIFLAGF